MSQNDVSELITDQEMAFARLVLAGTHTDRDAAQAVGLNPDTAVHTQSKPSVVAYMLGHRAAVQQQLAAQETEAQRSLNLGREQVLARLWDFANMSPEMTRGSITIQFKALSMIAAMEGLIPDRRTAEKKSSPPPGQTQIYNPAGFAKQKEKANDPEPSPAPAQVEDEPCRDEPEPESASAGDAPGIPPAITLDPSQSATTPSAPLLASAPDSRVPFSKKKRRRRR